VDGGEQLSTPKLQTEVEVADVTAIGSELEPAAGSWSGSTPTDQHLAMTALLTRTLLVVARRCQDDLPGLTESCQDDVLVLCGGTRRRVHGWFQAGAWRVGERQVHEMFLNADRHGAHPAVSPAEDILTTLLHEACHAWARTPTRSVTPRGTGGTTTNSSAGSRYRSACTSSKTR
jgi:hypothetical protein